MGTVNVHAPWVTLPIGHVPAALIETKPSGSDQISNVSISVVLKDKVSVKSAVILRVTYGNKEQMIVGSLDTPVFLSQSYMLAGKDLTIEHQSWHYPFLYIEASGSGSAAGGL